MHGPRFVSSHHYLISFISTSDLYPTCKEDFPTCYAYNFVKGDYIAFYSTDVKQAWSII